MLATHRSRLALALVCVTALLPGCAAPPTKELSQAEGAIEAARAAGAATYAADELRAAEATLARANTDVAARDFRAALGHALDASARAQVAATAAVEGRVTARLAADQTLDDFASLIEKLDAALATSEAKRVPGPARRRATATVATARATLRDRARRRRARRSVGVAADSGAGCGTRRRPGVTCTAAATQGRLALLSASGSSRRRRAQIPRRRADPLVAVSAH